MCLPWFICGPACNKAVDRHCLCHQGGRPKFPTVPRCGTAVQRPMPPINWEREVGYHVLYTKGKLPFFCTTRQSHSDRCYSGWLVWQSPADQENVLLCIPLECACLSCLVQQCSLSIDYYCSILCRQQYRVFYQPGPALHFIPLEKNQPGSGSTTTAVYIVRNYKAGPGWFIFTSVGAVYVHTLTSGRTPGFTIILTLDLVVLYSIY